MALTVRKRPESIILDTSNPITTHSIVDSTPFGLLLGAILRPFTGFSDGDKVLITNSLYSYNGFFTVRTYPGYTDGYLLVKEETTGDLDLILHNLQYTQDSNVTIYKSVADVDWSCVHLPIQYTLQTDLFPNEADTSRSVIAFANDNGLIKLTVSTTSPWNELDWITVSDSSVDELDGNFQIITKHSTTEFTINAPYSLAFGVPYVYQNAVVVKYYNALLIVIRVYAGLPASHIWEGLKPYELITELKVPPSPSGTVAFNVAEIVKEKLSISYNRPNYDSVPYDLDRFAAFYITYAEEYDSSDGVEVSRSTTAFTTDPFTGYAADSKLAFKNRYSGYLSEYVYASGYPAKFLSDGTPTLWRGHYFDISCIFLPPADVDLLRTNLTAYDEAGNDLSGTGSLGNADIVLPANEPSQGVIRKQIELDDTFYETYTSASYLILRLSVTGTLGGETIFTESKRINLVSTCEESYYVYLTWKNHLGGFNYWLFTSNKDHNVNVLDSKESDRNYFTEWAESYGEFADTIREETFRSSVNELTLRAENLSDADIDFLSGIKVSSMVQIVVSKYDKRTVITDASSFKKRTDNDKISSLEFTIRYTDNLPSQSL